MTRLSRVLALYLGAILLFAIALRVHYGWSEVDGDWIAVDWQAGRVVHQEKVAPDRAGNVVHIVARAPVIQWDERIFSLSFVSGIDGIEASCEGKTAFLLAEELVANGAYERFIDVDALGVTLGVDVHLVTALLGERLGIRPNEVLAKATIHRVRSVSRSPPPPRIIDFRAAAISAGTYLARSTGESGKLRYLVDAPTNRTIPQYDYPRHAGATYFMFQAAHLGDDAFIRAAALRSAGFMRDTLLQECGANACIGDEDSVEIGSSALAILAFAEAVRTGADPAYKHVVRRLADFLLAQQRPDGQLMHRARRDGTPIDIQYPYFSGEGALALARAHEITNDTRYLEASRRIVAYLVSSWQFFGSRYYFAEEHWTCQAMSELWDRAPNRDALTFCIHWMENSRAMTMKAGDAPFDVDGAIGIGPFIAPRLTPVASRCEAGVATLSVARRAGVDAREVRVLEDHMRRSLSLLARHQLGTEQAFMLADPLAVRGGMPSSAVSWQIRIDFPQHMGSAMVRWVALDPL